MRRHSYLTNVQIEEVIRRMETAMEDLPDPSVTLVGKKWNSPFLVLISCILSLRTRDETTLPASERLFALAMTPEAMLRLPIATIEKAIYPVGFYKTKAQTIHGLCRDIMGKYSGQVPERIEELLTMNGVGRKTANLVMIEGFNKPGICVDTHVHRISNRLGYVRTTSPDETEWALRDKLPKKLWADYNSNLVTWGQNICKPISPMCTECAVNDICQRNGVLISR